MINTKNVALMDGSPWASATNRVEIHTISLEESWQKDLSSFARPRSQANWSQDPQRKILDLKKITHIYTIQGWLAGSPTDVSVGSSHDTVHDMMKTMVEGGGVKNLTWETDTGSIAWYTVNFNKVLSRRDPKNENQYWVQMNLLEGEDR